MKNAGFFIFRSLSYCLAFLELMGVLQCSNDDLIVITESGRVRGSRYYVPNLNKAVNTFLGIPFAKPPVKHLRFRHPQPYGKWSGIYDATRLPKPCYQLPDLAFGKEFQGTKVWNPTTNVSEDCLYLNIWVPRTQPRLRKSAVMVWIYGGGFYTGTTTLNVYDGKVLAANNSIIVVSIAYRLGAFGFLSLNHPSAPGNAGLFDQLMALEWIQHNIKHFGGDPDNVTLFGESAGAVSVSLHLMSPLSHSKFQRVILQSGVANMPWATLTAEQAKHRSIEFAVQYLRCKPTFNDMEAIANCLKDISPQQLADEQFITRGPVQYPFLPVIDGTFLLESPIDSLRKGNFKRCPILLGSNSNEGSYFLIYELTDFLSLKKVSMNRSEFLASTERLFYFYPQYNKTISPLVLEAIRFQYTNWMDMENTRINIMALDAAVADYYFVCPVNQFAQLYSSVGENVYMYYLTQRYSTNPWPVWMGVLHGDDIMFVFGEGFKPNSNFSEEDKNFSQLVMHYWTNFAKTGDPNQIPGVRVSGDWPLYTPNDQEYLELNARFLKETDKSKAIGRGPRIRECAFWDEFLPQLVAAGEHWEAKERLFKKAAKCRGHSRNYLEMKIINISFNFIAYVLSTIFFF